MKKAEFEEILVMLKSATEKKKLNWSLAPNDDTLFFTTINGCRVDVSSYYDASTMSNKAYIEFYNTNGDSFRKSTYSENLSKERYNQLSDLYDCINNQYYKIKESEQLIIEGLRDMIDDE